MVRASWTGSGRYLAAALILLAICALAAGSRSGSGASIGTAAEGASVSAVAVLIAATMGAGLLLLLLVRVGLVRAPADEELQRIEIPRCDWLDRAVTPGAVLLVAGALVAAFAALAQLNADQTHSSQAPARGARLGEQPAADEGQTQQTSNGVEPVVAVGLGISALLGAAAIAVSLRGSRRSGAPEPAPEARREGETVRAAAREALIQASRIRDPREAVLAAYAEMESELSGRGLARTPPEAPLEYAERAGAVLPTNSAALGKLSEIFEEARFSSHSIENTHRDEALGLLTSLCEGR